MEALVDLSRHLLGGERITVLLRSRETPATDFEGKKKTEVFWREKRAIEDDEPKEKRQKGRRRRTERRERERERRDDDEDEDDERKGERRESGRKRGREELGNCGFDGKR